MLSWWWLQLRWREVDSICGYMLLLLWDGQVDSPGRTHSFLASRLTGEIALGAGPIPISATPLTARMI